MSEAIRENTSEADLKARAELFKALGHLVRLLILNLVQIRPRHGEELATILRLKPATISHPLSKLTNVGLLTSRKDQYYQIYSLIDEMLEKRIGEVVSVPQPGLTVAVEEDAYRDKVLKTFFRQGRLTHIPTQLKKRQIILEKLVQEFEPERAYPEHAINQILLESREDVATLRRELVSQGYMEREKGIYRCPSQQPTARKTLRAVYRNLSARLSLGEPRKGLFRDPIFTRHHARCASARSVPSGICRRRFLRVIPLPSPKPEANPMGQRPITRHPPSSPPAALAVASVP